MEPRARGSLTVRHGRPLLCASLLGLVACAAVEPDSARYRLMHSGRHWDVVRGDRVFDDVRPRYPEFFDVVLDPRNTREPDLLPLRQDMERQPVDRRNFDALNAVAIGYFEWNYRAVAAVGGPTYFPDSFRSAMLLAIPWRAYGEIEDDALRDAILDFFDDAASGEKLGTASTSTRLARILASLETKERDEERRARITCLTEELAARLQAARAAPP